LREAASELSLKRAERVTPLSLGPYELCALELTYREIERGRDVKGVAWQSERLTLLAKSVMKGVTAGGGRWRCVQGA
jgi:hypothetical protein